MSIAGYFQFHLLSEGQCDGIISLLPEFITRQIDVLGICSNQCIILSQKPKSATVKSANGKTNVVNFALRGCFGVEFEAGRGVRVVYGAALEICYQVS